MEGVGVGEADDVAFAPRAGVVPAVVVVVRRRGRLGLVAANANGVVTLSGRSGELVEAGALK